jgi:hypothetical protein
MLNGKRLADAKRTSLSAPLRFASEYEGAWALTGGTVLGARPLLALWVRAHSRQELEANGNTDLGALPARLARARHDQPRD